MKMCSTARFAVFIALSALLSVQSNAQVAQSSSAPTPEPAREQASDDSLKIYAVQIVETRLFKEPSSGDGIYLGQGIIITAAHVVTRWPFFSSYHVRVAGLDRELAAKFVKRGSFQEVDLAVLTVDEAELPLKLRLRRNPLCKNPAKIGMDVIDVTPQATARTRVMSPLLIAPNLRRRFTTLTVTPELSGSGVFDADRWCLMGIVSAKLPKYKFQSGKGPVNYVEDGYAGYFVPAPKMELSRPMLK